MLNDIQATSSSFSARRALTAALLVCLVLTGCGERDSGDPLEDIRRQQASGDFQGTVEPLRLLLAESPDDPAVNFFYGRALALTQRSSLATWSLRKAMDDPEWLVPAGMQLAFAALASRDFNEVVELTGRVLQQEPDNVDALLIRANAQAHWKKDPELALADADRVLELNPDKIEAYEPRILALLGLDRLEEASEALAAAGERLPELDASDQVRAWHCSTTAAFEEESGELEQAAATWLACLEEFPTDAEVVTNALTFYDAQGRSDRSEEVLRAALEGAPDARNFRVGLAQRLQMAGRAAEAEALLREATRSDQPEIAAAAWMDIARLRQTLGESGAAADALERAVELAREVGTPDPQLLFDYADTLLLSGRLVRALEVAEDLPVPAHQQLIRARVAQEQRNPSLALAEFDEALRLWPDNPWARYHAALAAEELGDFERAISEYRYSVRISPGATDARARGGALLLAAGNPDLALQLLKSGLGQAPLSIEGELLLMQLLGFVGDLGAIRDSLGRLERSHPAWVGRALAEAVDGVSRRAGPEVALGVLASAPGIDLDNPRYAAALRKLLRLSHETDDAGAIRVVFEQSLAAQPNSSEFQEIHGFDLELSGAGPETTRPVYQRALELDPGNVNALTALGRLALHDTPEAALQFFDRAIAQDGSDPVPQLYAARALIALGRASQAADRLNALLLEHPVDAAAAAESARLDLSQGVATAQTLDRARRVVRFEGGAGAFELLSQVYEERGEAELATRAEKRARTLREAKPSETQESAPPRG